MDKETIQKYAPTIMVIAALFFQYNVFVTPQQLEVTHREILEEISLKYATKEQNSAMKEQLSDMLPPVLLSVIMFVLVSLVNLLSNPYILKLVIQVVLGVIIYFLLATIFKLPAMNSVKDIIKSLIKKGR